MRIRIVPMLLAATAACARPPAAPVFEHEMTGVVPWTSDRPGADPDKFAFAIISDLNGEERAGSSTWPPPSWRCSGPSSCSASAT